MQAAKKLSAEQRRAEIINAARQAFAEKGFDGTTTRELATAAGVSEALMFKHFPNKEALYTAMQMACCNEKMFDEIVRLEALEPSASTLVQLVHFLVSRVLFDAERYPDKAVHARLMLRSLTEDGEFVRMWLQSMPSRFNQLMAGCLKAAVSAGDAHDGPVLPELGAWFAHHLSAMIRTYQLPQTPVLDYGVSREKLVEQIAWFTLRGMGLKEAVISQYYNPEALARFAE